jgi:acetyl xylan esterase AXE1
MATRILCWFSLCVLAAIPASPQTAARAVGTILEEQILPPDVATLQLRDYLVRRVTDLPETRNAAQWTESARQLRQQLVRDVVFHGWPEAWVKSPPKFEDVEALPGNGYRIRKMRYEIVPGFHGVALLYEPENLRGPVPAVLNVNGHGPSGKALEYKQKRCITFAQNGVIALNLEWPSYGELIQEGNQHIFGAHLDLAGANGLGLFYLAMRRGLDYLDDHPNVDRERLGMTGLSGGGWQTIVLSALDERVRVAVPVAGFSSTVTRVEDHRYGDLGDFEQNASDLFEGRDYPLLVAMRAPRPTMLIYNAEDSCCFRGPLAKPFVFDAVRRFFALYGKENVFGWHENRDPGTHNYLLDNRRQAYRFLREQFGLPQLEESANVGSEVRSGDELTVGVSESNLTILDLARQLANGIERQPLPAEQAGRGVARERLRQVIRLEPSPIDRVWTIAMTKHGGVESRSHIFAMQGGLSAAGVWLQPIEGPEVSPVTIVLDDRGRAESAAVVADRINRGEQVLALDLAFTGGAWKESPVWMLQQVVVTQGERPLGIRVAQLLELARWMRERGNGSPLRIEATGIRSQAAALMAAALQPGLIAEIVVRDGMDSLRYLYDKPIKFSEAPDLFCLDLYKETDVDQLVSLATPTTVRSGKSLP